MPLQAPAQLLPRKTPAWLAPATKLLPPAKQLTGMDAGCAGDLGCNRPRLNRRGNNPLLLRPRPPSATLNRRDHLDLRLRHRTIPRSSPMTSLSPSQMQGGLHRTRTIARRLPTLLIEGTT